VLTNVLHVKKKKSAYKVVKPEWILESIEAQQLLPWQNYRLVPRSTKQKELSFTSTDKKEDDQQKKVLKGTELNATILANDWAREASAANPEFIKRYYETSRLHYLSTWKVELKEIVSKLEKKYKSDPSKSSGKRKRPLPRVIM
jgi:DNA repair protein REV1